MSIDVRADLNAEKTKKKKIDVRADIARTAAPKMITSKKDKSYTGVDAEINRREASRSARYSMQPEVRAAEIKRAEARGDTKRASELKKAKDVEKWADEQLNSDFVKTRAQTVYDNEFNAAKLRGDQSPAVAAEHAAQGYLDLFRNKPQETRNETYAYRQAEKILEAANVFNDEDFGIMSERGKAIGANLGGKLPKNEYEKIMAFVNNDPYRNSIEALAIMNHGDSNLAKQISQLTEDEKKIIRYYAARGEKDKVEEFYKLMERELNERLQTTMNEQTRQEAYDKPILGAAKNIVGTMASPAAYIENAGNAVANIFRDEYIPTDYNTPAFRGAHMAQQTNEGVTKRASDAAGGGAKGEVASFLAGTGLSIANQLVTLPMGAAGSLAYMSAEAAGQTTLDALKRGASAEQALLLSTAAGTIEALTEKIPLDNLFKVADEVGEKGLKNFLKTLVKEAPKQSITEAGEEVISEIANTIMDIAVMKEKSGYEQYIASLMQNGMSRAEAEKEALIGYVGKNVLGAGVQGLLSGFIMGGGAAAVSKVNSAIESRNAGAAEGEAGFTKNEFSDKVSNKTIRALDAIGKKLGTNISIGAPTGTGQGSFNGYYENGRIVISQDADDPLKVVLSHEVTHRMKETAPEEYAKFLEIAVNATEQLSGKQKSEILEEYKTWYSEYSQTDFKYEDALDEITADFAGRIVDDLSLFKKLVDSDRNVAQRFVDGIRDFIAKVKTTFSKDKSKADTASMEKYGVKVSQLEEAVKQWNTMLKATEAAAKSGNVQSTVAPQMQMADNAASEMSVDDIIDEARGYELDESKAASESLEDILKEQKNTAETESGGERKYSLKQFEDGRRFVDVDADQHLFDGLSYEEKRRMATKIIKERFAGKVVGKDNRIFVNGRSAAEYGRPRKKIDDLLHDAKMRASTELDNLIDAGTNFRTEPDGRDGHIHPQAAGDFKYFDTIFKVGSEYYEGTINILPNNIGDLLIDITQIKNITQDIGSSYGNNPKSTFLRDNSEDIEPSNKSITDSSKKSKKNFAFKKPVEETKNLVALHNLTEEKLLKSLALGGFPMPSIAVTKSDIPHTNFGDITMVMSKETIDPKADKRNTVYSADAWTPTVPRIEYEVNPEAERRLSKKFYDLYRKYGRDAVDALYPYGNTLEDQLNREGGAEGIISRLKDDTNMMNVFLLDTGKEQVENVYKEKVSRLSDTEIEYFDFIINGLGEDVLNETFPPEGESPMITRKKWLEAHGAELEKVFSDYIRSIGMTEADVANIMSRDEYKAGKLIRDVVIPARNYLKNGSETVTREFDRTATNEAIVKAVDRKAYEKWLQENFGDAEKSKGIYNNKDYYTPSGNRRSFAQTHYPVTLEGIVKAMASQNGGNTKSVSGFVGIKTLRAGTAERFKSIAEMHDRESRLQHLTEEEAQKINDSLSERLNDIMLRILEKSEHKNDNRFIQMDSIGDILTEVAESGTYTIGNISKTFEKYGYNVGDEIATAVRDLLFDTTQMPVNIFEAKPERAVGFDEVLAAIVPEDASDKLKNKLADVGVNIIEYEKGNDADRLAKVNSVENAKFSFKKPKAEDSTADEGRSESDEEAFRRAFGDWAYDPEEEISYFDETGLADDAAQNPKEDYSNLDALYADLGQRENIIKEKADEREQELIDGAYKSAIAEPATEKKTPSEKISESGNYLKRKLVNSGAAIRDIAKVTKDKFLYPIYNRARGSMNIAEDMLTNKQTNIRGERVGESLEAIILPIKNKGKEYFREFHLYLLNKHNVARMSLENAEATARAKAELDKFLADNPQIAKLAALGEDAIQNAAKWDDARGFRAKQYLELRNEWQKLNRTKNKPIFFDREETPLSADISRTKAEELIKKHPEFAEHEAKVRKYLDNLMQYRVDSGLITQEEADYFRKKYPDYVPTYRNKESVLQELYGKKNIGKTLGIARGGVEKLLPLDIALAEMTKKVIKNGQKNMFANKLFGIFEKNSKLLDEYITDVNEGIRELDAQIDEFGEDDPKFKNTVGFYKDGKYIELTMTPKLYEAFAEMSKAPEEKAPVADWWRILNNGYKKLITTYDPTFIIRNGLKDLQDATINSRDTKAMLKNLPKAYAEIANGGELFELYKSMGGLHSSRFEEIKTKGVKKKSWVKKLPDALAFGNMMVEQAPRLAEFMSVLEKGDRNDPDVLADALYAAADVTTNFGESGTWGKLLNAYYVPFLNPAIQGTAKIGRLIVEPKTAKQWYGLAAKAVIMGVGAGFINDIIIGIFGDDEEKEEYEKLQDRVKDNYFLIPTDDGKFTKIPKGRIAASLGVIADRVRDVAKGEKVSAGEAVARILENIAPENPITNNILSPFISANLFNNESKGKTWYGGDIESDSLQGLPAGERFDSSTDYISKYVGKALGLSPKKINYILKQYTGGAGRTILPMLTPSEQKGDTFAGVIGYGALSILTSNFMVDSKLSNKVSGDFYDMVAEAEQKKNSSKGTLADKVVYKHLNRERNQMSGYNKKIREAETDSSLTSKERDVAVRTATASRSEYQKEVLDNLNKYRANVEKYLKEYPGKDEEKAIDYAYRKANYATYGAEYAIRASGGKSVYDKALEKVNRGKTTWKEYYEEYFGKDERRYQKLRDKYDISYAEYEKIAEAMSKNSTEEEEIEALHKLGYKRSTARGIRRNFNKVK